MNRFRKMIRNIIKKQDGPIEPAKTPEEAQNEPETVQEVATTLDMPEERLKTLLRTLIQEEQAKLPTAYSIKEAKRKARNAITEGRTKANTEYFNSPRKGEGKELKGAERVEKIREILEQDAYCTLADLGDYFSVTRERIRQILVLNDIEKLHGRHARLAHVTATFSEGSLLTITPPVKGLTRIPPVLAAMTFDNSHGIFDPDSPAFLGIGLEQIRTPEAFIIVGHCGEGHKRINFSDSNASHKAWLWRCFQCKPLYPWNFINKEGRIESKSQTKPCANCDKPVTKRAAILDRIINDPKYTSGDFFCSKKCFHNYRNYKSPKPWYTTSPVYQGHYWGNRPNLQRICMICKKTFTTKSTIAKLCGDTCKKKRVEDKRKLRASKVQSRAKQNNSGVVSVTLKKLQQEGISTTYVASHLNVSYPTVYNWGRGYTPRHSKEIARQLKRLLAMTKRLS